MSTTESRLAAVERNQERTLVLLEGLNEKLEGNDAWRAKTDRVLMGDGNGHKGHNVRLDRLEVSAERSKWLVRSLGIGLVLMVIEMLIH